MIVTSFDVKTKCVSKTKLIQADNNSYRNGAKEINDTLYSSG